MGAGTYYIRINSTGGSSDTAFYNLTATTVTPDSYEMNEGNVSANALTISNSFNATIDNKYDQDWYKFSVAEKSKVYITLENVPSLADYDIALYDSNLNRITISAYPEYSNEGILTLLEQGEYYVQVYSFDGCSQDENYSLLVNVYKPDQYEINESQSSAKSISVGEDIAGTIDNQYDVDWYKFSLNEPGMLTAELTDIPAGCNYDIGLYTAAGERLATSSNDANSDELINFAITEPAEYHLRVSTVNGFDAVNSYHITTAFLPKTAYDVPANIFESLKYGEYGANSTSSQSNGNLAEGSKLPKNADINAKLDIKNKKNTKAKFKVADKIKNAANLVESPVKEQRAETEAASYDYPYSEISETSASNDTTATAQLISNNSAVTGYLNSSNDVDYYRLQLNTKGKIVIQLLNVASGKNIISELLIDSATGITGIDVTNNFISALVKTNPHTYWVKVSGSGFTTNEAYRLRVTYMDESFVNSRDAAEMSFNDSATYAKAVTKTGSAGNYSFAQQRATIDNKNDWDFYKLDLNSGYKLTTVLKPPKGFGTYVFCLYDSAFNAVASENIIVYDGNSGSVDELLYKVPTTGTYYLIVYSYSGDYDVFNQYSLDFYYTNNFDSTELNSSGYINDNINNSSSVTAGIKYSCKLDNPYDLDWYQLNASAEGKITINAEKLGSSELIILHKDPQGTCYQYDMSRQDYVIYAQAGLNKFAVRYKSTITAPAQQSYNLTTYFTPKTAFDPYEYNKGSAVYPTKNLEFLYSNNQYTSIMSPYGAVPNLYSLANNSTLNISMDNPQDKDWFKIDSSTLPQGTTTARLTLNGIPSGDDYGVAVTNSYGSTIGVTTSTTGSKKDISFSLSSQSSPYYYVCVYQKQYTASSHNATLSYSITQESQNSWYLIDTGNKLVYIKEPDTESSYLEARVCDYGSNVALVYNYTNDQWTTRGDIALIPGGGNGGAATASVQQLGDVTTLGLMDNIKADLKSKAQELKNSLLNSMGFDQASMTTEDWNLVTLGITTGIIDSTFPDRQWWNPKSYLFNKGNVKILVLKVAGKSEATCNENYYYIKSKTCSEYAIMITATIAQAGSLAAAGTALRNAGISFTGGLLVFEGTLGTGFVPAIALEVESASSLVASGVCAVAGLAFSDIAKSAEGAFKSDYNKLSEAIKKAATNKFLKNIKAKNVVTKSSDEVNEWWRTNQGYSDPPYTPSSVVLELELTESTKFVRVYDDVNSRMRGQWFMKAEDVAGLTPRQIQNKFALPTEPKYIVDLELPGGSKIRTGEANSLYGFAGKGTQFDMIGQFIGEWINPRLLP